MQQELKEKLEAIANENICYRNFDSNWQKRQFIDSLQSAYNLAMAEKWVSVEQRLPDIELRDKNNETYVVVCEIDSDGLITGVEKSYFSRKDKTFWVPYMGKQIFPTHWMPLPQPPIS